MAQWFQKLKQWMKARDPESEWSVDIRNDVIVTFDAEGVERSIEIAALKSIRIATDDSGPWGDDVWWLFYDVDGNLACAYPLGATGAQDVLPRLQKLPGFNDKQLSIAMGSTSDAIFDVYIKPQ